MKKHVLLLVMLAAYFTCFSQSKPPFKPVNLPERNYDCIHKNKYSLSYRIKQYPFNNASQVKLVSYIWNEEKGETENGLYFLVKDDTLCSNLVKEIIPLNLGQIDTLTDIIYNTFYKGETNTLFSTSCYRPRNGILFYNSDGKIYAYIDICFECEQIGGKCKPFDFGDHCNQKFDLLRNFFVKKGIKYGPKTTVMDSE